MSQVHNDHLPEYEIPFYKFGRRTCTYSDVFETHSGGVQKEDVDFLTRYRELQIQSTCSLHRMRVSIINTKTSSTTTYGTVASATNAVVDTSIIMLVQVTRMSIG